VGFTRPGPKKEKRKKHVSRAKKERRGGGGEKKKRELSLRPAWVKSRGKGRKASGPELQRRGLKKEGRWVSGGEGVKLSCGVDVGRKKTGPRPKFRSRTKKKNERPIAVFIMRGKRRGEKKGGRTALISERKERGEIAGWKKVSGYPEINKRGKGAPFFDGLKKEGGEPPQPEGGEGNLPTHRLTKGKRESIITGRGGKGSRCLLGSVPSQ